MPKPSYAQQQFYPAPLTLLAPNPRLRVSHSIDSRTANALRNKEKELMQSSQRIDYYKDGLGTRAVLKTDDLEEKNRRLNENGERNEEMVNSAIFYLILNYEFIKFCLDSLFQERCRYYTELSRC